DAADMRRVLEAARPQLLDCYQRMVREGTVSGVATIEMRWTLDADGYVTPEDVNGGNLELQACVESVVVSQHFAPPAAAGTESDTFTFTPDPYAPLPPDAAVPDNTIDPFADPTPGGTVPTVTIDDPSVLDSGLDADKVKHVLVAAKSKLLACYKKG